MWTKALSGYATSRRKWSQNTEMLVKKGYQSMLLLHKLYSFKVHPSDLVNIYVLYIRSILEQSCQVWHYSITKEEISDLERVQKVACKIILQEDYVSYEQALEELNMQTLYERRDKLCLKFAKRCLNHPKARNMFPANTASKNHDKYQVQFARHSRLLNSSIPRIKRALNSDAT